jgi:hypothetical protein
MAWDSDLQVRRSAVLDSFGLGIFANNENDPERLVQLSDTLVRGTTTNYAQPDLPLGWGVVMKSAILEFFGGQIEQVNDVGIVLGRSRARIREATINTVASSGGFLEPTGGGLIVESGSSVHLESSLIEDVPVAGVLVSGKLEAPASAHLVRTLISRVRAGEGRYGDGASVQDGTLDLIDSSIAGSARAGAIFDQSSGSVQSTLIERNAVGLNFQGGSFVVDFDRAEGRPLEVKVDSSSRFVGNGIRATGEVLPLPPLPPGL